ncbi:hypothetical protein [Effusibacillus pohliae]|uniref:hypothetical protein n=1 Tax=Effusibacillus pohliae TaxID=232270 RepID=UPI0003765F2C|nr:hypothetical protein [Effusibacillus pohliae]
MKARIGAFDRNQPKSRCQQTGNASWGAKFDSFGNKITWFGYQIHLAENRYKERHTAMRIQMRLMKECEDYDASYPWCNAM